jgi:hypothetical protein
VKGELSKEFRAREGYTQTVKHAAGRDNGVFIH